MFEPKLNSIKKILSSQELDGIIITGVSHVSYLTGFTNFSTEEREAFLVIVPERQYILTDGRYTTAIKNQVKHFELIEISVNNSVENILRDLKIKHNIQVIGMDFADITHAEYKYFKKVFPKIKSAKLHDLRKTKNKEEILKIQQACKLGDEVFKNILQKVNIGVSEKEISKLMGDFVRSKGSENSFKTIVAFDANSAVPHHQTGDTVLKDKTGQFVLFDLGVKADNYCSDMTRTVFFGKPMKKQEEIYNTVLQAQEKAVEFIQSKLSKNQKVKAADVDKVAREYIIFSGYESIPHSLGHGIGLQVHEAPSLAPKSINYLEEGMVFSIEPGIYIPDFGGVRIEDLYVIEEGKIKQLTASPKDLTVI